MTLRVRADEGVHVIDAAAVVEAVGSFLAPGAYRINVPIVSAVLSSTITRRAES